MSEAAELVSRMKAVVFDLFHTLTCIESSWGGGLPATADVLGVTREAWHDQLILHSRPRLIGEETDVFEFVSKMARTINPTITDETIRSAIDNRVKRFGAAVRDIPKENIEVLQQLKQNGKKLGLVSNADVMEVAEWDESPIADLFDVTLLSCRVGAAKPDRMIYEMCLQQLEVSPREAVFVGDGGSSELPGARAVGMKAIMVTDVIARLWPDKAEARKADADLVIEHLSELLEPEE